MPEIKTEYRRNLPHLQPVGGLFFVTFRLFGTLPAPILRAYESESLRRVQRLRLENPPDLGLQLYREEKRRFARFDALLDQKLTEVCYLESPELAQIVQESLLFFNGKTYELLISCVMPNHVHAVFDFSPQLFPLGDAPEIPYRQLYEVLKVIKGYSARKCNERLGRTGAFWQRESYDHLIRDARELTNILAYVLNNPVKAGLPETAREWPFCYQKS